MQPRCLPVWQPRTAYSISMGCHKPGRGSGTVGSVVCPPLRNTVWPVKSTAALQRGRHVLGDENVRAIECLRSTPRSRWLLAMVLNRKQHCARSAAKSDRFRFISLRAARLVCLRACYRFAYVHGREWHKVGAFCSCRSPSQVQSRSASFPASEACKETETFLNPQQTINRRPGL